jgi:glycine dehydrogenase subunit 2
VASATKQKRENRVTALDMVKRLIDYGYHPPTIYFLLIAEEAMMLDATETKDRLDDLFNWVLASGRGL